jgi:hypothetical protein
MGHDILGERLYVDALVHGTGVGAGVTADERFEGPTSRADPSPTKRGARRLRC